MLKTHSKQSQAFWMQQKHKYLLLFCFSSRFFRHCICSRQRNRTNRTTFSCRTALLALFIWFDIPFWADDMHIFDHFCMQTECTRFFLFFFLRNICFKSTEKSDRRKWTANLIKMAKNQRNAFTKGKLLHKSRRKRFIPNARELMKLMRDCSTVMAFQN